MYPFLCLYKHAQQFRAHYESLGVFRWQEVDEKLSVLIMKMFSRLKLYVRNPSPHFPRLLPLPGGGLPVSPASLSDPGGGITRQDWCMVQLLSPPFGWLSLILKFMPLLISQVWCPWVMLTVWPVLMELSRAEGRPRLAELLPPHLLDSRVALVPNLGLARASGHRPPHCTHPWTQRIPEDPGPSSRSPSLATPYTKQQQP